MIDDALLSQYADVLGNDGVRDMLAMFNTTVVTYLAELQTCVKQQNEAELRQQAHRLKGALRSVGMQSLSARMAYCEKEAWTWPQVENEVAQLAAELPLHQQTIEDWLRRR